MKKTIAILLMMTITSLCFGATAVKTGTHNNRMQIYYHWLIADANDDFNDVNTLLYPDFYGDVQVICVDANGTDTSYDLIIMFDPREIGEEQVTKLYTLATFAALNATSDYVSVVTLNDYTANSFGGPPVIGDLYIRRANTANTMTDLKINLFCAMKD